jgi:patatin-like phospholipase/acyl hydrolase
LYEKEGKKIFSGKKGILSSLLSSSYDPSALENVLKKYFKETKLSELIKPTLITSYDVDNEKIFVFNSEEAKSSKSKNYYLKDVGRSTSAAPTYFPCASIKSIDGKVEKTLSDGGIAANNPTMLAYLESMEMLQKKKDWTHPKTNFLIISLGCGTHRL